MRMIFVKCYFDMTRGEEIREITSKVNKLKIGIRKMMMRKGCVLTRKMEIFLPWPSL